MTSRKKVLLKFIILGDSGVGRTSLMNLYVSKKFSNQYKATTRADFLTKEVMLDDRLVTMQIWDTAGQDGSSLLVWPSTEVQIAAFWCLMWLPPTHSKPSTAGETSFSSRSAPVILRTSLWLCWETRLTWKTDSGHKEGTGLVLQQRQCSLLRDQCQGVHQCGAGLQTIAWNALKQESEVELYNEFPEPIKLEKNDPATASAESCSC